MQMHDSSAYPASSSSSRQSEGRFLSSRPTPRPIQRSRRTISMDEKKVRVLTRTAVLMDTSRNSSSSPTVPPPNKSRYGISELSTRPPTAA